MYDPSPRSGSRLGACNRQAFWLVNLRRAVRHIFQILTDVLDD